ncbi:hypothetical protein HQ535_01275 [bacterium]|nr:hypothetical protein [bacterium]
MGLDDLFDMVGDFDPGKVKDVVETVWEDRDKIKDSVGLVWDNRDEILGVIDFFKENKDQILSLIGKLPDLLGKTGDGLAAAGLSAVKASGLLTGEDDDDMSAQRLAEVASDALDNCREELVKVEGLVGNVASSVSGFKIPTFEPKFTEIVGFNVVTGVDFGEKSLLDDAAEALTDGVGRLSGITSSLGDVSGRIRSLGARITEAGEDLAGVGEQLGESGAMLKQVSTLVTK